MSAFWRVFIILKVLVTRLGSNSQCSLHSIMSIMCSRRRTRIAIVQGLFCASCTEFCSIVSSLSLSVVYFTAYGSWWKKLCSLAHFASLYKSLSMTAVSLVEPFFSLNALFEESYLFSSTLLFTVIFLCHWNKHFEVVSVIFFLLTVWNLCYWRETEVLLMDYLTFLKRKFVELYHLFISITVLYGAHLGVYTRRPVVSKCGDIHSLMRTLIQIQPGSQNPFVSFHNWLLIIVHSRSLQCIFCHLMGHLAHPGRHYNIQSLCLCVAFTYPHQQNHVMAPKDALPHKDRWTDVYCKFQNCILCT